jgi:multiple antibiotic resistance protein
MDQILSYATLTFLGLFPITNPIGVVPTFYRLTASNSPWHRGRQARQVAFNVVAILALFLVGGRLILSFFELSLGALQVAGGLLIANTAWQMISTQPTLPSLPEAEKSETDIALIPMAMPIISGPGAIGMVMGLIAKDPQPGNYVGSLVGIAGIGLIVYLALALGEPLMKALGRQGINAFTRVLGFFILAISIQLVADGALELFSAMLS